MHVGIDLGTTNSALATFDGTSLAVVPNAQGESLTPSVVRVDARGLVTVGRRAFRFLETDPTNTRGEFKRLMGTSERIRFEASGQSFSPEELSARVVSSLLADAKDALGYVPARVVISTPALFELPQNHATVRAGKLAGLVEVELIQEPVASAIAAGWKADSEGFWLVFDLGGGTLDVSLLETRDGWLRVVDHGGDNFLGGKDFDNALVDWAAARLASEAGLPPFSWSDPANRRPLGKLKAACEQAKIELSRVERAAIVCAEVCADADGNPVDADIEIRRSDLELLVMPLIERSLGVCQALIEKSRLSPEAVERVVFVGGPTLMPALREQIGGFFGYRVAEGIDPMTLVARGAALYAATAGLEARALETAPAAPAPGIAVKVEHPAVTADTQPFVVGRFLPAAGEELPARVTAARDDGGFTAGTEVSPEGSFVLQIELVRHRQNRFRLTALTSAGAEIPVKTPGFAVVHGVSIADPPLSRSVGVARSDNSVHVYFEKGTPLPARRTVIHKTIQRVAAGSAEDALAIPVVQGEFSSAHLNRLIGRLQIRGGGLKHDLPAGTRIEVTLHLDRSGQLHARADVPDAGETFEDVVHVLVPSASPEVLASELEAAEARVSEARRKGFLGGAPGLLRALNGAGALLAEARAGLEAARGGDPDAAGRVHRLLLDLNGALEDAQTDLEWPALEAESDEEIRVQLSWISGLGTPSEQQLCERALAAVAEARRTKNAAELERQVRVLRALGNAAYHRDPMSATYDFDHFQARVADATDPRLAQSLLEQGRAALKSGDEQALRRINRQLYDLFPGTAEERQRSFGSGVR